MQTRLDRHRRHHVTEHRATRFGFRRGGVVRPPRERDDRHRVRRVQQRGERDLLCHGRGLVGARERVAGRVERQQNPRARVPLLICEQVVADRRRVCFKERLELWKGGHQPCGKPQAREPLLLHASDHGLHPPQLGIDLLGGEPAGHHVHVRPRGGHEEQHDDRGRRATRAFSGTGPAGPAGWLVAAGTGTAGTSARVPSVSSMKARLAADSGAVRGPLLQTAFHEACHARGEARHVVERRRILPDDGGERFERSPPRKRVAPREHLVEHDTERKHVERGVGTAPSACSGDT